MSKRIGSDVFIDLGAAQGSFDSAEPVPADSFLTGFREWSGALQMLLQACMDDVLEGFSLPQGRQFRLVEKICV